MKPYYEDGWTTIYHGDCREILPQLETVHDALITDPPFGIGFTYESGQETHNNPQEYWEWLKPIYKTSLTKLKPGAFVAIWQTQLYYPHLWDWFGNNIHIYISAKNFVQLRKTAIQYAYDPIIMKYIGLPELKPTKPKRNLDYFVCNTAKWVTQTEDIVRQHPCPRPIDQLDAIIENFTIENAIILDPFLGSGTTACRAKKLDRMCIGIETEEKYCEIAANRCRQIVNQVI